MHSEILSDKQREILTFLSQFKRSFYLVGGTAIALYLGHRRSIDFDLFTFSQLNRNRIRQKIAQCPYKKNVVFEDIDQMHYEINDVKVTFFNYPYQIEHTQKFENIISMPSLLTLAAMKAFALGRRAKWKDYVDLYFILTNCYSINDISQKSYEIFGNLFSEKLFRQQLIFFKDINYNESIEYIISNPPSEEIVRQKLIELSTYF